ncbi:MAG TPA: tetratricopeptide repeat protein [Polyangia bacterium]|jgi:tetratricopeptide (TPR) repeat protein|nr:tetratricopeptide repeat protein [Polyangia bacterium]
MLGLFLVLLLQKTEPAPPPAPPPDPMGQYLADLEKAGVLKGDQEAPTLEHLKAVIAEAEDDLVTGNAEIASVKLFKLIESPRYAKFDYAPEYAIAELTLARSLIRAGGYKSAERYLLRVLGRGTKSPAFAPAYRAMVDIALETHEQAEILAVLEHFGRDFEARGGVMPKDSEKEFTYLAAKVAYEAGDTSRAESLFSGIDRQSRFYAAALYFRGLIHARRGHYASARRSLCEIVEQVDQNRFTFFIDGRYYGIKDLAYLALGRISHEQEKYDDAYYFYFRVPEDSERLPEALFEASWSMFQAGEYEAANAFLEEFDRSFSKTPLAPDVMLLHAMINLKSCRFDDTRATLDKLVKTYGPLQEKVAALLKDPDKRLAFYRRLLSKRSIAMPRDPIIELLKIDPRFFKFYNDILALDREAGLIPSEVAVWDELTAHEKGTAPSNASEAVRLVNDVEALRPLAAGDPEMESRVADLADQTRRAARLTNVGSGPFAKEAEASLALATEARKLRAQLVAATSTIANKALVDLDKRLRELLRRARLTHIDAVIGKKKKLEIEIANLRQGRFPADLFATLQLEGLMGDDEEYWPFEGEYWSDEYENYK